MVLKVVVLDFDGTLTNVDEEAVPFVDGYKNDVAKDLGLSREALEEKWASAASKIDADPSNHGWKSEGRIVAPAYADPLVHSRAVAGLLLDETHVYDERVREDVLNRYFQSNYGRLGVSFKDGADEFLSRIKDAFGVHIVTNSGTDGVRRKVSQLPSDHTEIPIHGDAKKYILNPDWEQIPDSIQRQGYGRPLFLRRQMYWQVLSGIMKERGVLADEVAVVGDIYELDLLLPEHKWMHIVLTPRGSTPSFEVEAVRSSPLGYVARNLDEVADYLMRLR